MYFKQVIDWINTQLTPKKGNTKLLIHIYLFNCTKQNCINIHYTCTFLFFCSNILQADTDSRGLVISGQEEDASKVWRRQELASAPFTSRSRTHKYPVHMSSVLKNRKQKVHRLDCKKIYKFRSPAFTQSKETATTRGWKHLGSAGAEKKRFEY